MNEIIETVNGDASAKRALVTHVMDVPNAVDPMQSAAITLAHSNKRLDGKWSKAAADLNRMASELSSGDRSSAFQFLLSHVVVLDEIFNQLTRKAIESGNKKDLMRMLDYAFKAQNSSRQCLDTLMNHSESVEKRNDRIENMDGKINALMEKIGGNKYTHPITGDIIDTTFNPETMSFDPDAISLRSDLTMEASIRDAMDNGYSNNQIIKALLKMDGVDHTLAIKLVHELRSNYGELL